MVLLLLTSYQFHYLVPLSAILSFSLTQYKQKNETNLRSALMPEILECVISTGHIAVRVCISKQIYFFSLSLSSM